MKLRKICALFLASSLLLSVAACAPNTTVESNNDGGETSANSEAKVFTIGDSNPADPDDQYHYFCEQLNKNLQEICDGAIQFEIFSDSQFGTETEMFQAVSDGSLDAVCISNNIVSGSIPQLQVLDLPYFFDSEDEYQFLVDNEDFLNEITPIYEGTWNIHQFAPVLDASWRTLFTKG